MLSEWAGMQSRILYVFDLENFLAGKLTRKFVSVFLLSGMSTLYKQTFRI